MIRRPPRSPLFPYPPLSRSRSPPAGLRPSAAPPQGTSFATPAKASEWSGSSSFESWPLRFADQFLEVREPRSEEHTSELQSRQYLVCRLLLEKKKNKI